MLDVRISVKPKMLQYKAGKKYTIITNDTFKIILDTIPLRTIVSVKKSQDKQVIAADCKRNEKVLNITYGQQQSATQEILPNALFGLSGKKLWINKCTNIFIYKPK
jgi:hypothetical protein